MAFLLFVTYFNHFIVPSLSHLSPESSFRGFWIKDHQQGEYDEKIDYETSACRFD